MSIPKANLQLSFPAIRINLNKAYTVLNQFDTSNVKAQLLSYPEKIKAQKLIVNQKRQELRDAELSVKEAEASLMVEIAAEIGDNGKAKFSNAEARAAELLNRKKLDPNYYMADQSYRQANAALEEAQSELDKLYDEYKSYRYIARLVAEELAVINNLSENEEVIANE